MQTWILRKWVADWLKSMPNLHCFLLLCWRQRQHQCQLSSKFHIRRGIVVILKLPLQARISASKLHVPALSCWRVLPKRESKHMPSKFLLNNRIFQYIFMCMCPWLQRNQWRMLSMPCRFLLHWRNVCDQVRRQRCLASSKHECNSVLL